MTRRNALLRMFGWLMAGFFATTTQQEYSLSAIEQVRDFHTVLATAVYEKKIKWYTAKFTGQKTIIFRWSDL